MQLKLFHGLAGLLACFSFSLLFLMPAQSAGNETLVDSSTSSVSAQAYTEAPPAATTRADDASRLQAIGTQELQPNDIEPSTPSTTPEASGDANTSPPANPALNVLGTNVGPGESHRLLWVAGQTSYGSKLETPVYVIRGTHPGKTLCLTSAIHGDELNGIEIVRKLVNKLSPKKLHGTVIGVPIVNLLGFTQGSRYLPDRRDLNRYFPGNPNGSSASRIAYSFFEEIVGHCDFLIDLHTGSLNRTNMPQVRANLKIPAVVEFTTKFGSTAVLHSRKLQGNLRSEATNQGIPAVALELGEPGSLQQDHVEEGVRIVETVLSGLDMTHTLWEVGEAQPVFYSSRWVRVNSGGLLISKVEVGERVSEGALLGAMVNPITNESIDVVSPYSGRVLGMALSQFMLPGYAAFNIGIVADKDEAVGSAQTYECSGPDMQLDQGSEEFDCPSEQDDEIVRNESEAGE